MSKIIIIRIAGMNKMDSKIEDTMYRLGLQRKYACVLIEDKIEMLGMLKKVKDLVAFGKTDEKMLAELIAKRGKLIGGKASKVKISDPEKIAKEVLAGKELEEFGIKHYFRLHPARGGINTKLHYPRGVIGNHKDKINVLLAKML